MIHQNQTSCFRWLSDCNRPIVIFNTVLCRLIMLTGNTHRAQACRTVISCLSIYSLVRVARKFILMNTGWQIDLEEYVQLNQTGHSQKCNVHRSTR